jgi:hypothetical protein
MTRPDDDEISMLLRAIFVPILRTGTVDRNLLTASTATIPRLILLLLLLAACRLLFVLLEKTKDTQQEEEEGLQEAVAKEEEAEAEAPTRTSTTTFWTATGCQGEFTRRATHPKEETDDE